NSTLYANRVSLISNAVSWSTNFKTDVARKLNLKEAVKISLLTGDGSSVVKTWTQANTGISSIPFAIEMKEGKYKIKVESIQRPGVTGESYVFNITHNYFSAVQAKAGIVRGVGKISLTYPKGGEIIKHGSVFKTTATSLVPYEKFTTLKLIKSDGTEVYSSIRPGVGSFIFTSMPKIINGYELNGQYKIQIIPFSNPALAVESKLFTITDATTVLPPTTSVPTTPATSVVTPVVNINLVYPTNNSTITYGTSFYVKWNMANFGNKMVSLSVTDSTGYITYVTSPKMNNGSLYFSANQFNGVPAVGKYKIRITAAENAYTAKDKFSVNRTLYRSNLFGESLVNFVAPAPVAPVTTSPVSAPTRAALPTTPSIVVTVPPRVTPGYLSDGQLTVNWTAANVTGSVRIELLNSAGVLVTTLSISRPITPATFIVDIPAAIATGQYKVKITGAGASGISAPFTITKPVFGTTYTPSTGVAKITVTSPTGGTFSRTKIIQVKWTQAGLTGNVKVELLMAGKAPVYIGTMAAVNGYINYTIPAKTLVGNYVIKVSSLTNTAVSATSPAFRIWY
ncbi:MAG TPA: hypothetical protein P5056_03155, partial [Candidatus Paceibacterota bacterium]|nr:hypothetical protein [Candidatus Paceibacterota bacterium]